MRGDFDDRCATHPVLATALQERAFVLGPMSEQEMQRAITGPAAAAGLAIEDGLAEQVVRELVGHLRLLAPAAPGGSGWAGPVASAPAGALPLLSMAMARTWANHENGRLTRHGYDRAGGVASAVKDAAEDAYASLSPRQQQIAERVIPALTITGADGQITRRRASLGELANPSQPRHPEQSTQSEQADLVQRVVEVFTAARLMVTGPLLPPTKPAGETNGPPTGIASSRSIRGSAPAAADNAPATGTVELAHDVLVTAWPRLQSWLAGQHADRILHGQILQDAAEWNERGRDPSFLYRGIRLETASSAAARWHADPGRYLGLPGPADAFLRAGARAATRTRHRWQALFMTLAGLLVIAIVTAVVAVHSSQEAERQRAVALSRSAQILSRQVAAYSQSLPNDPAASARLAAAAWAIVPTDDARASMAALLSQPARAVLTGHTDYVYSVAFSPDGTRLASAGVDQTVRIWARPPASRSAPHCGAPLTGHTDYVSSVAFSPDGTHLASAGRDQMVRIWDVALPHDLLRAVCGIAGRSFTPQEWERYIPDEPYRPSCPASR
ncbi:hypothetical protein [Sphaerisporangium album]|uniref:nSTAND1 domain-containing NTPase n=1 Tax=Sphaerisporangium album TaxID=509200 RepID=UPI00319E2BDC